MIKQISIGLLLGIAITLFRAQSDPWAHKNVGTLFFKILATAFNCNVSGTVESISIIPARMTINHLLFSSSDKSNDWSWHAKKYTTGFSWFYLLFGSVIRMWVRLDNVDAYTATCDGQLAIYPHVKDLLKGPNLPIAFFLKSIDIRYGILTINNGLRNTFYWNSESKQVGTQFRSQFFIYDGSVESIDTPYIKNISGKVTLSVTEKANQFAIVIRVNGKGDMPQLGEYPTCFLSGRWFNDRGRFQLYSADDTFWINPLILSEHADGFYGDATINAPIAYLNKLITSFNARLNGTALLHMRGSLRPSGNAHINLLCEDIKHDWFSMPSLLRSSLTKRGWEIDGSWNLKTGRHHIWHGSFLWDMQNQQTNYRITNSSPLIIPSYELWQIEPDDMKLHIHYDNNKTQLTTTLSSSISDKTKKMRYPLCAHGTIDNENHIHLDGSIGKCRVRVDAWNDREPRLNYLEFFDEHDRSLSSCHYDDEKKDYHGAIDISLLRFLSMGFFHYDVQAEGTLLFNGHINDYRLYADTYLNDATVRLPQTLNFLHGATASWIIDTALKKIELYDLKAALHTGSFVIPAATVSFDANGHLQFAHVPLIVDHCLFTVKHDLFAMISGGLLLQKQIDQHAKLHGTVVLDRSQLKENLFSQAVQKKLFTLSESNRTIPLIPLTCDIVIETKEPIRIDTHFLQANAHCSLRIKDQLKKPTIIGTISVPSGSIKFPYKPLYLTKGDITFLPEQPFNPLVEISAKNTIKNYNVALHVTGSLQDHMILLESTPPLTEEQIVGLLLAGAHEESLQAAIPTLLMQNVTNYIFSSHRSNFFDQYIKPWMKQINVHLMPNFNDQSGRGGLRGALEIIVNDRWRALIEKNFTLTEDTRFELEYILSDDVTFRVIRDERCDIGGEVEMRWKF